MNGNFAGCKTSHPFPAPIRGWFTSSMSGAVREMIIFITSWKPGMMRRPAPPLPPRPTRRAISGRDLLRRAPFPPAECVEIIGALCEALEFLHGRGLIHRDIKPANIIFVNGRPKLADVGLVAEVSEQRPAASMVGTEGYLPPEGPGTAAGDVFALGKVLEEMLRSRQQTDAPPDGAAHEHLRAIIRQACAPNPAERFASATAMRKALSPLEN